MKRFIVAAFMVFAALPAMGADMPRTGQISVLSLQCRSSGGANFYCRQDFRANCKKGSAFPFPRPPEKIHENWPHRPNLPLLRFEPNTARCVETELRGKGYVRLLGATSQELQIEYGCEANIRDDAFVYGFCEAQATR